MAKTKKDFSAVTAGLFGADTENKAVDQKEDDQKEEVVMQPIQDAEIAPAKIPRKADDQKKTKRLNLVTYDKLYQDLVTIVQVERHKSVNDLISAVLQQYIESKRDIIDAYNEFMESHIKKN